MSEWPEHAQELSRKAIETLDRAMHKTFVENEMSERELFLVLDTIVDCCSGLIPKDVLDFIYYTRQEIGSTGGGY